VGPRTVRGDVLQRDVPFPALWGETGQAIGVNRIFKRGGEIPPRQDIRAGKNPVHGQAKTDSGARTLLCLM